MTHKPKGIVDPKYKMTKGQKGVADGLLRGENRLDVYPRFFHVTERMKKPGNEYMIQNAVTNIIALPNVKAYMKDMSEKANNKVIKEIAFQKHEAWGEILNILQEAKNNMYLERIDKDGNRTYIYRPDAASIALKATEAGIKLFGLDAPTKTDMSIEVKMGTNVEKYSE